MHEGGAACVSIQQEPYDYNKHGYASTYFEEDNQEDVVTSEIFRSIANMQVDHFNIIGGGMYKVELCIYLKKRLHIVDLESVKVASYLGYIELLTITEVYQENSLQYIEIGTKIVDGVRSDG